MNKQELIETYKKRLELREKTKGTDKVDYYLYLALEDFIANLERLDDIPEGYEVLNPDWIAEHTTCYWDNADDEGGLDYVPVSELNNLIIPNPQSVSVEITTDTQLDGGDKNVGSKVAVPKFVAKWIEEHKTDYTKWDNFNKGDFVFRSINDLFRYGEDKSPYDFDINNYLSHWTTQNPYEFIQAIIDGYEIEEEKEKTIHSHIG